MKKISLFVPFVEGTIVFELDTFEPQDGAREDQHYHWPEVEKLTKAWRRFPMKNRVSLEKALDKTFPNATTDEVVIDDEDRRMVINLLVDDGEVYIVNFGRGEPFGRYLNISPCSRIDENGEHINKDGIPIRLINCMTGVPYPPPPVGMHRYTVSINFSGGGSYYDAHKMIMAATPKEAAQQVIDDIPAQKKEMGDFAEMFMSGDVGVVMVTNKDTQHTDFFEGASLGQSKQAPVLGALLNRLNATDDQDEVMDILAEGDALFPGMRRF